jgi:Tfp pilus assembly protein PilV
MEAVVVMAIFSMLVITFSEIYVRSSRGSAETAERARIESDARTMLESIARAARVSNIDYATYAANGVSLAGMATAPVSELDLANPDGNAAYRIKENLTDGGCWNDGKSFPCIVVSTDAGLTWSQLSPKNSKVAYLNFFLAPAADPFSFDAAHGTYLSNAAPIVTVGLGLQGFALYAANNWTYSVQTSVTPRYYKR